MRKKIEPEEPGCPLWMMTFGDAMSLLVTFFVMLVSFASFEEHTLLDFFGAMQGGLRATPVPMATMVGRAADGAIDEEKEEDEEEEDEIVQQAAGSSQLQDNSSRNIIWLGTHDYYINLLQNGVSLVIREGAVFKPGTAELTSTHGAVWKVASDLMSQLGTEIRIEAALPENALVRMDDYRTPWGLGIEQSLAVRQLLIDKYRGRPSQISSAVRVVKAGSRRQSYTGIVEVRFLGLNYLEMDHIPRHIIRGLWRDSSKEKNPETKEQDG